MRGSEITRAATAISAACIVLALGLIPNTSSREHGCRLYSRIDGDTTYVDPAYNTRFRIKGDEVAIRLESDLGTNESAFRNISPGEGVYLRAIRQVPKADNGGLADETVMEVVAANVGGKIKWALGYKGDTEARRDKVLLANNLESNEQFECMIVSKRQAEALDLKQLKFPGVNFGRDEVIKMPTDSAVLSKLGL